MASRVLGWSDTQCINRKCDGGLELSLKIVQQRMGHSTIVLTADLYSHLFPRGDDSEDVR